MRRQALKAALRHLCRKHGTSARVEFIRARASTVDYRVDDKTPARILDECRLLPTWSQQMEAAALRLPPGAYASFVAFVRDIT